MIKNETLDDVISRYHQDPHSLVQILRETQRIKGWLPHDTLVEIAHELNLTLAHVIGVAGFYRFFHTRPVGTYRVLFSDNITDRMLGSETLLQDLCRLLHVKPNQIRADGRVSVSTTSCTGLCEQGPAALINHLQVVTRLTSERIERMAALIEQQVPADQWPTEWSHVDDTIRLADVKLGTQPIPGQGIAAALARGPQAMLDDIKHSKLRGRGGAGYATGTKWQLCRDAAI